MAYQVVFQQLSFQPVDPDQPTVPSGPEEIVLRGGLVPDYVTTFQIAGLASAGMIVAVAEPDPGLVPADALPEQPRTPDQPTFLPNNPNSPPVTLGGDLGGAGEDPADEPVQLPSASDKKEVWEAFAQRPEIGMTQGDAEAMNKTDLMAEVKTRFQQSQPAS